jgi:hypothetical protein
MRRLDLTESERMLLMALGADDLPFDRAAEKCGLTYGSARTAISRMSKRNGLSKNALLYWVGYEAAVIDILRERALTIEKTQEFDGLKSKADGKGSSDSEGIGVNPAVHVSATRSKKGPSAEPVINSTAEARL